MQYTSFNPKLEFSINQHNIREASAPSSFSHVSLMKSLRTAQLCF